MKPAPLLLALSLVANLGCAVVLALRPALAPPAVRDFFHLRDAAAEARRAEELRREASSATTQVARAAAVRSRLWSALDTADLKALVASLRAAGFPAMSIRAIVSARLEKNFAARRREIAGRTAEQPYWKPEAVSGNSNNPKVYEEMSQLYRERARLIREVLGDDFFAESAGEATAEQRRQFGDLPKSKIDVIQRINDDYAEMTAQIRAGMQGVILPEDREKLALLEREKRADLAAVLSADELRDYEMRSSTIATRLKAALGVMGATEEEFRTIYAIQQPLADRLYPVGGVKGAEMARQRREAEKQVADQLAAALGPSRAADFARAGDYEFQQLYRTAQRENLPADTAARTYDLRASTTLESRRIAEDKATGADEKRAALQALAQTTRAQLVATLGSKVGESYASSAEWLKFIAGGGSVVINGSNTTFYPPPPPSPAKPGN